MQLVLELFLELKALLEAVVAGALLAWLIVQLAGGGSETRRGWQRYPGLTPILL